MNPFEKKLANELAAAYCPEVTEIALEAAEIPEFQKAVKEAKNQVESIIELRELLKEHFPQIPSLPDPSPPKEDGIRLKNPLGGMASNEFKIAKNIVDLLWDK